MPTYLLGQNPAKLPSFYPIAEHTYGIKEGLPDMYMTQVLIDQMDRLHILKNGHGRTAFSLPFYGYDGTRAYPSSFEIEHKTNNLHVDIDPITNQYYGYYHYEKEGQNNTASVVFTYDPLKGITNATELLKTGSEGIVKAVVSAEGMLFALVSNEKESSHDILQIHDQKISTVAQFKLDRLHAHKECHLAITASDFWITINSNFVFRIGREKGIISHHKLSDKLYRTTVMVSSMDTVLWIANGLSLYYWNAEKDTFLKNPYKPASWNNEDIQFSKIFKDSKGNLLVVYRNKEDLSSATLIDTSGYLFNYTPILDSRRAFISPDFKQNVICFDPGLRFVEVADQTAIKKSSPLRGSRGVMELSPQTLFLNINKDQKILSLENGTWAVQENTTPCLEIRHIDGDMATDSMGFTWFNEIAPERNIIGMQRYHTELEICDTFQFNGLRIYRFDFIDKNQLALAGEDSVYIWDSRKKIPRALCKHPFKKAINQIFVDKDKVIWLAGDQGLLKIHPQRGEVEQLELIKGQVTNVQRIHQAKDGRLWLGTVLNGILIYDTNTRGIRIIDQAKGLSNNTVVTLLEDNDGDIWAGTFYGITILSPNGAVIGKLYEEDGLANNECNRWSALKMKDGRLCFGSVAGPTIIDPSLWKSPMQGYQPPHIFLTALYSDTPEDSSPTRDYMSSFSQHSPIILPAQNRNLKVVYVLSNYASPEKSTFAYQLEGIDKDWNYIGTQRQLSLNALPAGSYNLLIKGTDGRGKWSDPPIVIPLIVEAFFYTQWWFFVLCAVPFLGFFLLWQHRQRGERKRLEQEVQKRTATIREQADKLLEANHMKSNLYTNITHEFRTPLTVILGMADLLKKNSKTKELIVRNSQGLLRLVNQILDLAKLESGHLKLDMIQADIIPYLKYLMESLQSYAERTELTLVFQSDIDHLMMDFDEKKLEIITSNLLTNAIKFSEEGGKILFDVKQIKEQLIITVTDHGIGISPENIAHIFNRFYQVDTQNDKRKGSNKTGSGVGLTLTKELVELMDGNINVDSTTDQGTTFTISLPISNHAPIVVQEYTAPLTPLGLRSANENGTGTVGDTINPKELPLLLLVEDNEDVAAYITACLQDFYTVDWAKNGAIGIERALSSIPDAIISDVMMPEKNGFEVCQTLKGDERTNHIPIILLTAKIDIPSRMEGLGAGADAYLAKPFLKEELLIRLAKMVELRRSLQEKYASSDFTALLDTAQDKVDNSPEALFLKKASLIIQDHIDDSEFGNQELSQQMAMSESQLNRKIKALTDQTLSIFIRNIRLQKAKILIETTSLNISEIAYAVGFSSPAYFSSTFSKRFGAAPNTFRR